MTQLIKVESVNCVKRPHKLIGTFVGLTNMALVFLYFGFKPEALRLLAGVFK